METLSYSNPNVSPGSSSQSFTYNNLWQLTDISANPALISMQYVYPAGHNNGRISQTIDGVLNQTVNYTYDSLNRLSTAEAANGAWGQSYSYDGFGNLTAKTVTAGSAQQFNESYSATTNQQTAGSYDANGNSLYGPYDPNGYRYQYYFDVENRLVTVGSSDGSPGYSYGYDPQNKRVMVLTSGGTQSQYWSLYAFTFYGISGQRLSTFEIASGNYGVCSTGAYICSNGVSGSYLYLAGKRLAQPDGYSYLADRLGSQRENGQAYYPWGEPMNSPAPAGDVEFATYWRDMVGQDYADQRYYNSNAGRFYTPDPIGMAAVDLKNPTSWNMYAYVGDDPVNFKDRRGLFLEADPDDDGDWDTDDYGDAYPICFLFPNGPGCNPWSYIGATTQGGGVQRGSPNYGLARAALYGEAADLSTLFQGNGSSLTVPCQNDLAALGLNAAQISQAASNVVINNGVTSTANYALAIFGNSPAYSANAAVYGSTTVAQYMVRNPGTVAVSQGPGNNVYINASWVNGLGTFDQEALLLHELIHNITGNVDSVLQGDLGLATNAPSINIANKLGADCLK